MENLKRWLSDNEKEFILFANVLIGLVASIFIFVNMYKVIKALSGGNMGDAAKNFVYALLIAVVAYVSVTGIKTFVSKNKPTGLIDYGNP